MTEYYTDKPHTDQPTDHSLHQQCPCSWPILAGHVTGQTEVMDCIQSQALLFIEQVQGCLSQRDRNIGIQCCWLGGLWYLTVKAHWAQKHNMAKHWVAVFAPWPRDMFLKSLITYKILLSVKTVMEIKGERGWPCFTKLLSYKITAVPQLYATTLYFFFLDSSKYWKYFAGQHF